MPTGDPRRATSVYEQRRDYPEDRTRRDNRSDYETEYTRRGESYGPRRSSYSEAKTRDERYYDNRDDSGRRSPPRSTRPGPPPRSLSTTDMSVKDPRLQGRSKPSEQLAGSKMYIDPKPPTTVPESLEKEPEDTGKNRDDLQEVVAQFGGYLTDYTTATIKFSRVLDEQISAETKVQRLREQENENAKVGSFATLKSLSADQIKNAEAKLTKLNADLGEAKKEQTEIAFNLGQTFMRGVRDARASSTDIVEMTKEIKRLSDAQKVATQDSVKWNDRVALLEKTQDLVQGVIQVQKDQDRRLQKTEAAIKTYQTHEDKLKSTTDNILNLNQRSNAFKTQLDALEKSVQALQTEPSRRRAPAFEAKLKGDVIRLQTMIREAAQRIEGLEGQIKESPTIEARLVKLEAIGGEVDSLQKSQEAMVSEISCEIEAVNTSIQEQNATSADHAATLEQHKSAVAKLNEDVDTINISIQKQNAADYAGTLEQHRSDISKLKDGHQAFAKYVDVTSAGHAVTLELQKSDAAKITARMTTIESQVVDCQRQVEQRLQEQQSRLQALTAAVQNHDSRLNNTTTESMVQHMSRVILDAYPHLRKAEQELAMLGQKVFTLDQHTARNAYRLQMIENTPTAPQNSTKAIESITTRLDAVDTQISKFEQQFNVRVDTLETLQDSNSTKDEQNVQYMKDTVAQYDQKLTALETQSSTIRTEIAAIQENANQFITHKEADFMSEQSKSEYTDFVGHVEQAMQNITKDIDKQMHLHSKTIDDDQKSIEERIQTHGNNIVDHLKSISELTESVKKQIETLQDLSKKIDDHGKRIDDHQASITKFTGVASDHGKSIFGHHRTIGKLEESVKKHDNTWQSLQESVDGQIEKMREKMDEFVSSQTLRYAELKTQISSMEASRVSAIQAPSSSFGETIKRETTNGRSSASSTPSGRKEKSSRKVPPSTIPRKRLRPDEDTIFVVSD